MVSHHIPRGWQSFSNRRAFCISPKPWHLGPWELTHHRRSDNTEWFKGNGSGQPVIWDQIKFLWAAPSGSASGKCLLKDIQFLLHRWENEPIGFSVKDICQTFEPATQFKKENISGTFWSPLCDPPGLPSFLRIWENQYLKFCVNNLFSFSFNNIYLYMTWFLFCTILNFTSMESYYVFGDLVFIQYYVEWQPVPAVHSFLLLCAIVYHLFIWSHVSGHLGCFSFSAIWNNVTMKRTEFLSPDSYVQCNSFSSVSA